MDVLTHERLQWEVAAELVELRAAGETDAASRSPAPEPSDRWIAVPRDALRVAAVQYHPLDVIAVLRASPDQLKDLAARTACLCYWGRLEGESIRILELDPITATVVAGVDGRRSVADVVSIAQDALSEDVTPADLRFVLDAAVGRGLVGLVEPAAGGR